MKRALSTSSFTRGTMYNWRVKAMMNALEKAGKATGPLQLADLTALGHLDQYHYLGTQACDHVIELLGIQADASVLDIGSGIGGPARYLSANTGCQVVGVELQAELTDAGAELTARVEGLAERVAFVTGDFSSDACALPQSQFDHFVSLLVFLHIPDRAKLLSRCFEHLKPGGSFVIEDFVERGELTPAERATLSDTVKAPTVSSTQAYVAQLHEAGFVDIEVTDMSGVWQAWTKARHELFASDPSATVALHGQDLFDERRAFYRAIDELFAGGNLGGARISGRRPGAREVLLRRGRLLSSAAPTKPSVQVVEGSGGTMQHAAAAAAVAGAAAPRAAASYEVAAAGGVSASQRSPAQVFDGAAQKSLPWRTDGAAGMHDSLQYHFFFPGVFVALRVFHTASLQSVTAWAYDFAEPQAGAVELVNTYVPLTPLDEGLHMENDEVHIADGGEQGVSIVLRPTGAAASALLTRAGVGVGASGRPELKISAAQGHAFGWMPAGSEAATQPDGTPSVPVIHRPAMAGSIAQWRGAEQQGYGYSKRYAAIYARYNAWRFIHGVATPAGDSTFGAPTPPSIVWTADATFGDDKYNYYKLLPAERHAAGELTESVSSDTYNQADAGYATIAGVRHSASLEEVAKWHTIINDGSAGSMEAKYENRLCKLTLRAGDAPPLTGLAYNERYMGTLW